jgi:hypothetical protein
MLFIGKKFSDIKSYHNWDYGLLLILCTIASWYFSTRNIESMQGDKRKLIWANLVALFLILVFSVTERKAFLYFDF